MGTGNPFESHCFTNLAIMAIHGHEQGCAKMEVVICDAPSDEEGFEHLRVIHCYIDQGDGTVYDISRDPTHRLFKNSYVSNLQPGQEIRISASQARAYWTALVEQAEREGECGLPDTIKHSWNIVLIDGCVYHDPEGGAKKQTVAKERSDAGDTNTAFNTNQGEEPKSCTAD